MLCALTVRKLKAGTFDDFREAFMRPMQSGQAPEGWVRFNMIRNVDDPDEVICFGFFEGDVETLRQSAQGEGYQRQQEEIKPFVESVGADGLYDIVEDMAPQTTA